MQSRVVTNSLGFSLIEVLSALVVISLGVLTVLQLTSVSLSSNMQSGHQSNANYLVNTLADRMRLNPEGDYTVGHPNGTQISACHNGGCSAADSASNDIFEWQSAIRETLPNGVGNVTGVNPYIVSVSWQKAIDEAASSVSIEVLLP
jgi:type IV pilus assembly protein PilV